jgi:hypothetical protein
VSKPIPKVGDTVWMLAIGNRVSRYKESELEEARVLKVGRKYFTVANVRHLDCHEQFHLDTWRHKYEICANYALYSSPEELAMEKESNALVNFLHQRFYYRKMGLSLDQLRRIKVIIEEGKPS